MGLFIDEKVPEKAPPPPPQGAIAVIFAILGGILLAILTFILKMLTEMLTPVAKGTGTWLVSFEGLTAEQKARKKKLNVLIFIVVVFFVYKVLAGLNLLPARYVVTEGEQRISQPSSEASSSASSSTITVDTQLRKDLIPLFPRASDFDIQTSEDSYYHVYDQVPNDHRTYFRFNEVSPNSIPIRTVTGALCQIIPTGKKMGFVTRIPPSYVFNMDDKVIYMKKEMYLNPFEEVERWVQNQVNHKNYTSLPKEGSWEKVYTNWHTVDNDAYSITAKASSSQALGGMVCF